MTTKQLDKNLAGEDMKVFAFKLLNEPLFVPDSIRDYAPLLKTLKRVVEEPLSVLMGAYNDADELRGVFGVINIVPETDARFVLWTWGKPALTHHLVRDCRDLITYVKGTYELRRVTALAASEKQSQVLQLIGFKVEGRFRSGYKHKGQYHNLFQLRIIGEL
jgi:hypothetical protein